MSRNTPIVCMNVILGFFLVPLVGAMSLLWAAMCYERMCDVRHIMHNAGYYDVHVFAYTTTLLVLSGMATFCVMKTCWIEGWNARIAKQEEEEEVEIDFKPRAVKAPTTEPGTQPKDVKIRGGESLMAGSQVQVLVTPHKASCSMAVELEDGSVVPVATAVRIMTVGRDWYLFPGHALKTRVFHLIPKRQVLTNETATLRIDLDLEDDQNVVRPVPDMVAWTPGKSDSPRAKQVAAKMGMRAATPKLTKRGVQHYVTAEAISLGKSSHGNLVRLDDGLTMAYTGSTMKGFSGGPYVEMSQVLGLHMRGTSPSEIDNKGYYLEYVRFQIDLMVISEMEEAELSIYLKGEDSEEWFAKQLKGKGARTRLQRHPNGYAYEDDAGQYHYLDSEMVEDVLGRIEAEEDRAARAANVEREHINNRGQREDRAHAFTHTSWADEMEEMYPESLDPIYVCGGCSKEFPNIPVLKKHPCYQPKQPERITVPIPRPPTQPRVDVSVPPPNMTLPRVDGVPESLEPGNGEGPQAGAFQLVKSKKALKKERRLLREKSLRTSPVGATEAGRSPSGEPKPQLEMQELKQLLTTLLARMDCK